MNNINVELELTGILLPKTNNFGIMSYTCFKCDKKRNQPGRVYKIKNTSVAINMCHYCENNLKLNEEN